MCGGGAVNIVYIMCRSLESFSFSNIIKEGRERRGLSECFLFLQVGTGGE